MNQYKYPNLPPAMHTYILNIRHSVIVTIYVYRCTQTFCKHLTMVFLLCICVFSMVFETGGMFSKHSPETNMDPPDTFMFSPVEFNDSLKKNRQRDTVQISDRKYQDQEYLKLNMSRNLIESHTPPLIRTTNSKTTASFMLSLTNRIRRESRTLISKYSDFTSQFGSSLEMILATQMLNCPSSAMCTTNQNAVLDKGSCCESSCSCAVDCRTLNTCCPDADVVGTLSEPRYILKCVEATYLTRIRNMALAYRMVTYCSNHSIVEWVNRCTKQDETYPLLVRKIPVSSLSYNGTVFQNKYCAWCNGHFDIIEWKAKFACTEINPRIHTMVSLKRLEEEINDANSKCNIVYVEPTNMTSIKCEDKQEFNINTCNVTGNWDTYDSWIESACRSYYQPYIPTGSVYYRNVFCFICNIQESAAVGLLPDISKNSSSSIWCNKDGQHILAPDHVFSAVLDFDIETQHADEVLPLPREVSSPCDALSYYDEHTVCIHVLWRPQRRHPCIMAITKWNNNIHFHMFMNVAITAIY